MARTIDRQKLEAWAKIVHKFEASGLSAIEFCKREGLSAPSLYWWKKKVRERGEYAKHAKIKAAASIENAKGVVNQPEGGGMPQLRSSASPASTPAQDGYAPMTLRLPGGMTLEIGEGKANLEVVKAIVESFALSDKT